MKLESLPSCSHQRACQFRSFLHIWVSVQHKGVQALATLDEKLEQTLFPKPCFLNPKHFLLFADLGVGTAQGGASPGNPR